MNALEELAGVTCNWVGAGHMAGFAGTGEPLAAVLEKCNREFIGEAAPVAPGGISVEMSTEEEGEVPTVATFDVTVKPSLSTRWCRELLQEHHALILVLQVVGIKAAPRLWAQTVNKTFKKTEQILPLQNQMSSNIKASAPFVYSAATANA